MHPALEGVPEAWIRAVTLWNPNAIITGRAAARLTFAPDIHLKEIHVYHPRPMPDRGPLRFRRQTINPEFVRWVAGTRVTDVVATALTAGIEGDFEPGTTALRSTSLRPGAIAALAEEWSLPFRPAAKAVALDLRANPWSVAEVDAHRLFRRADIRGWAGNAEVWLRGRRYAPDISIRKARIAFEVNSYEFHSSTTALERDATRLNAFLAAGWRSYALSPRQLRDHPDESIEFIRSVVWGRHRSPTVLSA